MASAEKNDWPTIFSGIGFSSERIFVLSCIAVVVTGIAASLSVSDRSSG
jgi:hypothetical protein